MSQWAEFKHYVVLYARPIDWISWGVLLGWGSVWAYNRFLKFMDYQEKKIKQSEWRLLKAVNSYLKRRGL